MIFLIRGDLMTTGEAIKKARIKAKMTQAMLAKKLNVTPQNISQYERDIKNPKKETLEKMADALGCSKWDLMATTTFEELYKDIKTPKYDEAGRRLSEWTLSSLDDRIAKLTTSDEAMTFLTTYLEASGKDQQVIENLGYNALKMNESGQKKATENVEDLAKIPDYQKDPKK